MEEELVLGDLYALSALRMRGVEPLRAAGNGRRTAWTFAATPELHRVLEDFYGRKLNLDALTFAEQIRSAKGEAMSLRKVQV